MRLETEEERRERKLHEALGTIAGLAGMCFAIGIGAIVYGLTANSALSGGVGFVALPLTCALCLTLLLKLRLGRWPWQPEETK